MRKIAVFVIFFSMVGLAVAGLFFLSGTRQQVKEKHEAVAVVKEVYGEAPTMGENPAGKPVQQSAVETQTQTLKEVMQAEPLKIIAVGDILLGRGVEMHLKEEKKDYLYPFEKVADLLKKGDIVFGNLEEPITSSTHSLTGIKQGGKWILKNQPEALEGIRYAGFNLLSLANNHILDFYEKGLFDTIEVLDKNGIAHAGAGKNLEEARKLAIIEKNGTKIGLLAYTDMADILYKGNPQLRFAAAENKPGVSPIKYDFSVKPANYNTKFFKEEIERVRNSVDILIISLHWGIEESFVILPQQIDFAHFLLDNGADMILGHHPHQFQGIEIYKGKPVVYSMGNFIFDQNDPENQEAFILEMDYKEKKLSKLTAVPVRTMKKTQVVPQAGEGADALLKREAALCRKLGTACHIEEDRLIFELN